MATVRMMTVMNMTQSMMKENVQKIQGKELIHFLMDTACIVVNQMNIIMMKVIATGSDGYCIHDGCDDYNSDYDEYLNNPGEPEEYEEP